jgi:RNA polymerase sigma-70 factor, ECF subfamily
MSFLNTSEPFTKVAYTAETFAELLTLIQQGSAVAEAELVAGFHKGLFYAMRHRIGDETLALDICQDTWRILVEKFRLLGCSALEDCALLPAYIHNTAMNVYLAEVKRVERRRTDNDCEGLLEIPDSESEQPLDQIARARVQKRVRQVIESMNNPRDKLVLYRYYIQEQTKEQICSELGLEHRHFDRVAHRARERLRLAVERTAVDLQHGLREEL